MLAVSVGDQEKQVGFCSAKSRKGASFMGFVKKVDFAKVILLTRACSRIAGLGFLRDWVRFRGLLASKSSFVLPAIG
ncbi:MAG: hypothetical protein B6I34_09110 [Anaerolineaceae bacterium 4572_32.1]|nr:MAG: hypothetical protein B6I34_09110 [Anaerolineaceae bacterium 4572_32.1]